MTGSSRSTPTGVPSGWPRWPTSCGSATGSRSPGNRPRRGGRRLRRGADRADGVGQPGVDVEELVEVLRPDDPEHDLVDDAAVAGGDEVLGDLVERPDVAEPLAVDG